MIRRLDEHPDFEGEAITRARGRLMRLACELPPREVLDVLRHAQTAYNESWRPRAPHEGEVVPFPGEEAPVPAPVLAAEQAPLDKIQNAAWWTEGRREASRAEVLAKLDAAEVPTGPPGVHVWCIEQPNGRIWAWACGDSPRAALTAAVRAELASWEARTLAGECDPDDGALDWCSEIFEGAPVMLAGDPRVVKGLLRELEVELGAEGAALAGAQ